ncbi:MAG: TrkA C-terminal domain-containing protein [Bacteroidales bacterium]
MDFFSVDYAAFFLIVAIGIALGRIKIKGISLDISAIIFVALVFGHFGVKMPPVFQPLGLILFMFSVGIQAGPGFFEAFRSKGKQLIILALIIISSGVATTIALRYLFQIDARIATGLFTGAITSTSGLAAAIESTNSPLASIGFGLAYPFGVIGVILFARLSPKLFKVDIQKQEQEYEEEVHADHPILENRNYVVENKNVLGKSLKELQIRTLTHTNISKILRNGIPITPKPETELHENDIIRACGTDEDLEKLTFLIGPETQEQIPESKQYVVRKFLVSNKEIIAKTFGQIGLLHHYNATVTSIRRSGIDITPTANSRLRFGDKLTISAPHDHMPKIGAVLGDSREKLNEIDFLPIAIGVLIGILIGKIPIPLPNGMEFKLGLTGGVLISALGLSKIGKTGAIVWNISGTTNQFLRKLGLIFFLATVGTQAGETLVETVRENGIKLIAMGAIISLVPMFTAIWVGTKFLKLNFLSLIGALTGSMTSTPALSAIEPITKTNAPQVAYATVYPFALVLIIIASQILALL